MVGEVLRDTIEQTGQNVAQLDDFTKLNKNSETTKSNQMELNILYMWQVPSKVGDLSRIKSRCVFFSSLHFINMFVPHIPPKARWYNFTTRHINFYVNSGLGELA